MQVTKKFHPIYGRYFTIIIRMGKIIANAFILLSFSALLIFSFSIWEFLLQLISQNFPIKKKIEKSQFSDFFLINTMIPETTIYLLC